MQSSLCTTAKTMPEHHIDIQLAIQEFENETGLLRFMLDDAVPLDLEVTEQQAVV